MYKHLQTQRVKKREREREKERKRERERDQDPKPRPMSSVSRNLRQRSVCIGALSKALSLHMSFSGVDLLENRRAVKPSGALAADTLQGPS